MKRFKSIYTTGILLTILFGGCSKIDNYPGPTETLMGTVRDKESKEGLQTEVSGENGNGTRVKLLEISWSDNPTPLYLASKQDGSYINTKVFAATYEVIPEGAFVPLGESEIDPVEVKGGVTQIDFEVDPFLRLTWQGEPVLNADGTVSVKVKVDRGTTNTAYHKNIMDVTLFVNTNPYVGNNNYDSRFSPRIAFSGSDGESILGEVVELTSTGPLPAGKPYFLRAGARIAHGLNIYNYTAAVEIFVP